MSLKLPVGWLEVYLFDCDGTIVDSMPLHYIAWQNAKLGVAPESCLVFSRPDERIEETLTNGDGPELNCGPT